jgi:catechol 2,3-dioxygenase-like lactoylglutathione lyase family enzyme
VRHLGFAVDDLTPLLARAQAAGIRPHEVVEEGGYRRAYFQDPDGHELEFVARCPKPAA